jgi:hypothetical protein
MKIHIDQTGRLVQEVREKAEGKCDGCMFAKRAYPEYGYEADCNEALAPVSKNCAKHSCIFAEVTNE